MDQYSYRLKPSKSWSSRSLLAILMNRSGLFVPLACHLPVSAEEEEDEARRPTAAARLANFLAWE